ncbi:radical SAM protein [Pyrolobus fumarii]|uniref:radical SAM protein n=1 Tax=Pyrolobus fumarii TaxID=54252 RepID=UPI000A84E207|nr:radical SAM protein [Pyrolobus fumarii]
MEKGRKEGVPGVEGVVVDGRVWGKPLVRLSRPAPLMGTVFIGVIDRGTNVLQVRPTTLCNLSCIFCSVDAGPSSRWRQAEFIIDDVEWLVTWVEEIARYKGVRVEALIDGVGEPTTYPRLVELIRRLKESPWVESVALETHGQSLDERVVREWERAGLDRINLSIDTLDAMKAKMLTGVEWYDLERVKKLAEFIARETRIDLHVTPVWIPGVNDEDVPQVVKWAVEIGAGKRWPPATVQKFLEHRHGRKPPGVREIPWNVFWRRLREWSRELGVNLIPSMEEWGMRYARKVPEIYREGDVIRVVLVAPGWLKREVLAVSADSKRLVTVVGLKRWNPGDEIDVVVLRSKDNIYVARPA